MEDDRYLALSKQIGHLEKSLEEEPLRASRRTLKQIIIVVGAVALLGILSGWSIFARAIDNAIAKANESGAVARAQSAATAEQVKEVGRRISSLETLPARIQQGDAFFAVGVSNVLVGWSNTKDLPPHFRGEINRLIIDGLGDKPKEWSDALPKWLEESYGSFTEKQFSLNPEFRVRVVDSIATNLLYSAVKPRAWLPSLSALVVSNGLVFLQENASNQTNGFLSQVLKQEIEASFDAALAAAMQNTNKSLGHRLEELVVKLKRLQDDLRLCCSSNKVSSQLGSPVKPVTEQPPTNSLPGTNYSGTLDDKSPAENNPPNTQ